MYCYLREWQNSKKIQQNDKASVKNMTFLFEISLAYITSVIKNQLDEVEKVNWGNNADP